MLIVNSEYSAERKQVLMRNLLTPLMEKFKVLLEKLMMAQDEDRQMALADCLNHAVGFARWVQHSNTVSGLSKREIQRTYWEERLRFLLYLPRKS